MSNKSDHDLIVEIHSVIKDPDNGLCKQVAGLKSAVYGNGKIGLRTQIYIMWGAIAILMVGGKDAVMMVAKAVVK